MEQDILPFLRGGPDPQLKNLLRENLAGVDLPWSPSPGGFRKLGLRQLGEDLGHEPSMIGGPGAYGQTPLSEILHGSANPDEIRSVMDQLSGHGYPIDRSALGGAAFKKWRGGAGRTSLDLVDSLVHGGQPPGVRDALSRLLGGEQSEALLGKARGLPADSHLFSDPELQAMIHRIIHSYKPPV